MLKDLLQNEGSRRKKCPYSEFFWFAFCRIQTEYEDLLCKSPHSVRIRENADLKNSEYRHFLRSGKCL